MSKPTAFPLDENKLPFEIPKPRQRDLLMALWRFWSPRAL